MVQTKTLQEDITRIKADAKSKGELIESLKLEIEELRSSITAANKTREVETQQLNEQLRLADQARAVLEKRFDEFRDNVAVSQLVPADFRAEFLQRSGIDLGSQSPDMPAALRWAAANGHGDAVGILIQRGFATYTADSDGVTALHLAAKGGHTAIVKQLLSAGAPIEARMQRVDNSTDRSRGTPLHWAAIEGHIGPMMALLDAHAEIDARNAWYRTPLHVAARFGHLQAVELLVDRGADKEARRDTHETPLHFAVEDNQYSVVAYLLSVGADINANARGMCRGTPLRCAYSLERTEIAKLLESWGAKSEGRGWY